MKFVLFFYYVARPTSSLMATNLIFLYSKIIILHGVWLYAMEYKWKCKMMYRYRHDTNVVVGHTQISKFCRFLPPSSMFHRARLFQELEDVMSCRLMDEEGFVVYMVIEAEAQ